jgi:hypothetical protein
MAVLPVSSTSEYLPRPEPSNEHQHVWEHTGRTRILKGMRLAIYGCYACGIVLVRGGRVY